MGVSDEEIKYVRDNFDKKYADKISSGNYDDRDLRRLRTDDVYVTTFIRGPSRLDEGVDLVHESLQFRKEYGVNDMTEDSFEQWMWDKHAVFYHGQTKTGHKIVFLRVKHHKKDAAQMPLVKKFFVFWLEMAFKSNPVDRIVTLFDMTEAGLSNLDMEFIRFILTCFKLYYPTFLEKLLIYEMPWIFNAAWKVIKTWLSAEAIAKIKFVTKSDVHTYIDHGQLFEHMGGTCDLDSVNYYPRHSEHGASHFSDASEQRKVTFSESTESLDCRQTLNLNNNAANRMTSPRPGRHNSNSSASEGSSYSGRLLTISPAEELCFVMDEQTKEAFDIITLSNTLMYPIAFKVKTTAPEKYRVRPSTGIVKPGDTYEVYIYVQPGYINTVEKDKFLVMAMEVTGDSYDTSLWKTAPKETIMEHRLRCLAPGQADFNVNVALEGGGSKGKAPGGVAASATQAANQARNFISSKLESQMEMLIESNRQLQRRMGWLIASHIFFFILTMIFFAAFFCLGEDLFSSYLYFPFGYCVSSSWSRRC
ncbi:motile sperm domain-containing protein 2-like [Babylonia areolata]|uniref:motile sperm domain-containing protein 2-like n=1 Tax=Babylonia areolata TaxID=304850 RepID=UPI003FD012A9